ncbi:HDOD domain protein [Leptospira interrogans serovar Icterohaemorrhagiae str. Verdun HP]|uniref:HDOD domain protein n=2 Tax=Leptospira interrogans TaxID=173 RepID=M6RXZ7_LEPIR|nr:HDOD domain protein [Leptospira interrogans serovar Pyrogenes str. L0374]EMO05663.1 HDOD domain protein [Leptospira interrogans serovar Icterohaemorrhagiae str. Verdun HP]
MSKKTKSRLGSGVYRRAFTQYRKGDPCRFLSCSNSISQRRVKNSFRILWRIGKKHFGYSHEEVGQKLLEKWNFPKELIHVTRNYSQPENEKEFPELVSVIHVSHSIAVAAGVGIDIAGLSIPISNKALQILEISDSDLQVYYTALPEIQKHIRELIQA